MVKTCNSSPFRQINRRALRKLAEKVWKQHKQHYCRISLNYVALEEIVALNRSYFDKDQPTDVISFNLGTGPDGYEIGDIYICPEVAQEYANEYGVTHAQELARVTIHGVLHFIGYDDATPAQKQQMRRLEDKYLELYAT